MRRDSALIAVFESLYEVTITATNGTVQGAGHYAEGDVVRLSSSSPQRAISYGMYNPPT